METETPADAGHVRELPIVGGHLALDFANTVDDPLGPARRDHIATYAGLVRWSVELGVLSDADADGLLQRAASSPRQAGAALERAQTLRRLLNSIFAEVAEGRRADPADWEQLRPFLTDAVASALLTPNNVSYALTWETGAALDAVLWPIAKAAADLLTSPELGRVKRCAGCPWVFVDRSKNASRRWCSMDDCGRHEKIRRYVSRRAERRRQ